MCKGEVLKKDFVVHMKLKWNFLFGIVDKNGKLDVSSHLILIPVFAILLKRLENRFYNKRIYKKGGLVLFGLHFCCCFGIETLGGGRKNSVVEEGGGD